MTAYIAFAYMAYHRQKTDQFYFKVSKTLKAREVIDTQTLSVVPQI